MAFTFLHTSDWHIGRPFGRIAPEQAGVLRHARLTAIDRLADAARDAGAKHVLVAGDLFDRPNLSDRDLRAPVGQMQSHTGLVWHVIPGNHDPAGPGGVWERAVRDGLPANLRLYLEPRPVEIEEAVWLLPAPLAARSLTEDPTAWMDAAPTPDGAFRIGLAHGSIQGFGSERDASILIAPDRPRRARLDYLALGDWHGAIEIGPRAAYSGTPEPDGFLDNSPGLVLVVAISGGTSPPHIARKEIGTHRWLQRSVGTLRTSDIAALEGEIEGLGAHARRVLLQVEIVGRITMAGALEIQRRLDRLEARVLHLERNLDRMVATADDDDIGRLSEGAMRAIGQELSQVAADDTDADQRKASRALQHLFDLVENIDDGRKGAEA